MLKNVVSKLLKKIKIYTFYIFIKMKEVFSNRNNNEFEIGSITMKTLLKSLQLGKIDNGIQNGQLSKMIGQRGKKLDETS